ncbi:MAG: Fe-S cluster assembly protein SufD [Candidatus Rokuibacteriota bacterium]
MAVTVATAKDRYLAEFEALERQGTLRSPSWLAPLRRQAIDRFAERGFPTTRDEDWRYTNLASLAATPFRPAGLAPEGVPAGALETWREIEERHAFPGPPTPAIWPRLVFVDGRYSPELSTAARPLPGGGRAGSLAEAMITDGTVLERHLGRHACGDGNVFAALGTAFVQDGAFVCLPAEARSETPIELVFLAATPGVVAHPRTLIVAGLHSRLAVVERYVGLTDEAYFTNAVTEIVAGPGAAVDHYVLQEQGAAAFHVATLHAALARDSAFATCGASFGGRLARTTLSVAFAGEGARSAVSGLYVVGGRQHVDHHVTVDHAVARCASQQLFKGVLDGTSRAVFNGRIVVRPGAQKTDAIQTNKHLLLSDGVEVDSKPQLEIFADDVKCTHGAAEGQLAPEALFYLKSRGMGEAAARALLTYGFAREVLERVAVEPLQAYLDRLLMARLRTGRATREIA